MMWQIGSAIIDAVSCFAVYLIVSRLRLPIWSVVVYCVGIVGGFFWIKIVVTITYMSQRVQVFPDFVVDSVALALNALPAFALCAIAARLSQSSGTWLPSERKTQ